MFGKGALIMVLGFSLLFLTFGHNFNNMAIESEKNETEYMIKQKAYYIAVSGANMAANEVFMNNNWEAGYKDLPFDGGIINVYVSNPLVNLAGKVAICHRPPGNVDNEHTIYISSSAVGAHLAHGDYMGICDSIAKADNIITIISEGTFGDTTKSVVVKLRPSKFSKFAYFSNYEPSNIWWTNNDTVWGPMHVNGDLRVYRHPVFMGKTTIKNKIKYYSNKWKDEPVFNGGFEKGINLPIPTDGVQKLKLQAEDSGVKFTGQDTVMLTFQKDSIKVRFGANKKDTAFLASTFSPNGVIFAENAVLRIKGEVQGKFTVVASGSSGGKGTVYFDDDIKYADDPRKNPNSTDLLGVVAEQNAYITDNAANNNDGIDIQASIFCQNGGFGAENYDSRPAAGDIRLLGGITQAIRRAVGTFSSGGTNHGFNKRYRYDNRLMLISPPHFPGTGFYEIVSWYE